MSARTPLVIVFCAAALLLFAFAARQLSFVSLGLAANTESQEALRRSLDDQKALSHLDPEHREAYRRRFDETRTLLTRLEILALTRQRITRQFELVLVGIVGAIVAAGVVAYVIEQRNRAMRLAKLSDALQALSRGDTSVSAGVRGRDVMGRIGSMIEETSRVMGRERKRVQYLEHLSSWQEAARRHAHEMRTPLTAAQMEVSRAIRMMKARLPEAEGELTDAENSIVEELEHLRRFTRNFVAFATIGTPRLETHDLSRIVSEFCTTFAPNWPNLELHARSGEAHLAKVDREMLRQVLVNLCNNSALAIADRRGTVTFNLQRINGSEVIDVCDDGPGVATEVKRRIFEPYTTTRRVGEGMGLGLAISKKIMLDHGGDLELLDSATGATFRLSFQPAD